MNKTTKIIDFNLPTQSTIFFLKFAQTIIIISWINIVDPPSIVEADVPSEGLALEMLALSFL